MIHQITPVEFRSLGNYGKIPNIRFVCGPLGGGEFLPDGLLEYVKGHKLIEYIRTVANKWCRLKLKLLGNLNFVTILCMQITKRLISSKGMMKSLS